MNKKQLAASLEEVIDEWIGNQCENDTWPDCYVPSDLSDLMTDAALGILFAIEDAYRYLEHEDVLK